MINGIKPQMTKTTELRIKPTTFDEAMDVFCVRLTENCQEYIKRFDHMDSVQLDFLRSTIFQVDFNSTTFTNRRCILSHLIAFRQIRIEIVFTVVVIELSNITFTR